MARPTILMQEDLLSEIWAKYNQGVPVLTLIKQYEIEDIITPPTLTKLLKYVSALENINPEGPQEAYELIYNSLFPTWIGGYNSCCPIVTQPKTWKYIGNMPFGKWEKR